MEFSHYNKKREVESVVFTRLPHSIILLILNKLPIKTLLELRCVSKLFASKISHLDFMKLHLSSSIDIHPFHLVYTRPIDYKKSYFSFHIDKTLSLCKSLDTPFTSVHGFLRIVGCSKGVMCLYDTSYCTYVGALILWNPLIGKFKLLPFLDGLNYLKIKYTHAVVGFGFDHGIADFKVVKILYDFETRRQYVIVYGGNTGQWRIVDQVVPCYMPRVFSSSVFVNGVVHWLAYDKDNLLADPNFDEDDDLLGDPNCEDDDLLKKRKAKPTDLLGHPNCIMGFDLGKETFMKIDLPQNLELRIIREFRLSPMVEETSVVLFVRKFRNDYDEWDVWLMSDNGRDKYWVRMHTIVMRQIFFPLKIVSSVKVLAAMGDGKLKLVDVEKGEIKDLGVCGVSYDFYTCNYAPSLALLDVGKNIIKHLPTIDIFPSIH